jgi:hypothetical protein
VTAREGTNDKLLRQCLEKVVWDLALPPQFAEEWNSWSVEL